MTGIATTILTKPTERWLVVVHKRDPKVRDVQKAIERHLPADVRANVAFIQWGSHVATNDYADVPNLILAGTLFMRPSFYVALTHLAQDRPTAPGFASRKDIERTTRGEHANLVLQAICRGRVRKSDGPRCLPMDAYLIAASNSGIGEALTTIFPGCTVVAWDPLGEADGGPVAAAEEFLQRELARGKQRVSYKTIQETIGVTSKHFAERVTARPEWARVMDRLGLETYGGTRRARGVQRRGPIRLAA